jgi:pilus assembly protein CpaE
MLSFPATRIKFILNRANTKVGLSKREVESALKVAVHAEVPSDRAVPVSVNRGTPAVLSDPGSDFSKAMIGIAKGLVAPEPKSSPKQARKRLSMARG